MSHCSKVPNVKTLAKLFIDGWEWIEENADQKLFAPGDRERITVLKNYARSRCLTLRQLGALVNLSSLMSISNFGYVPITPVEEKNPLELSCFQFGQGRIGWYFAKGSSRTFGYTYVLFRLEIAPPAVVKASGLHPSQAVLYSVTAGAGSADRNEAPRWWPLPPTIIQGDYECKPDSHTLFSFQMVVGDSEPVTTLITTNISLSTRGTVDIYAKWTDCTEHILIDAWMKPKRGSSAVYNGPQGCQPCIVGAGTLYWSFTNMEIPSLFTGPFRCKKEDHERGEDGWFDHQWFGGLSPSAINRAVSLPPERWLWIPLQFEATKTTPATQYMILKTLPPVPPNELPRVGDTYTDIDILNKYTNSKSGTQVVYGAGSVSITVLEVELFQGSRLPTKYSVTITETGREPVTYILRSRFGAGIVYLSNEVWNSEVPGVVLDVKESKVLGATFLEANQLSSTDTLILTTAQSLNLPSFELALFLEYNTAPLVPSVDVKVSMPCTSCTGTSLPLPTEST
ncbi:Hypothetical protein POVN_LOCUS547 [uncultured virus]|nr:Hypothetical protein POVN_LOCUS547 [uncultured virus]